MLVLVDSTFGLVPIVFSKSVGPSSLVAMTGRVYVTSVGGETEVALGEVSHMPTILIHFFVESDKAAPSSTALMNQPRPFGQDFVHEHGGPVVLGPRG